MFEELKKICATCEKCPLHLGRTHSVFGYGAEDARIMLVGEAPGPVSYTHPTQQSGGDAEDT